MTKDSLDRLGARRDRFMAAGKALLIAATLVWCGLMAFYDISVNRPGLSDILLNSRTSYILVDAKLPPLDHRSIWGGPAALFGLQCFAGLIGTVAMIALFREWLNRGRISRLGVALAIVALSGGTAVTVSSRIDIYPLFVSADTFSDLIARIEAREPGLIGRLKAGERPALPRSGGEVMNIRVSSVSGRWMKGSSRPVLVDQRDAEGLRFALAQQAYMANDLPTLRRLLPIDVAVPPTDEPARYDIARRLSLLSEAAGVPAIPAGNITPIAADTASWQARVAVVPWLRRIMQILLLAGFAAAIAALAMRRHYSSIELKMAEAAAVGRRRFPK